MENSEPNGVAVEKLVRKRSSVERTFVWGGIALLLLVVLIEWTSLNQFKATLNSLDTALRARDETGHARGIPSADAERYVKGFPFRSEETIKVEGFPIKGKVSFELQRIVTFRWPSLFKLYKVRVSIDEDDKAILAEAIIPGGESSPNH